MSEFTRLACQIDRQGVAVLSMARPEVHNAFDEHLIEEMTTCFIALGENPDVRIVVLAGAGKSFSAGADLNWMRRMAAFSDAENVADAQKLAQLLAKISTFPKPVIARVHGAALGGGVGLVAACDIAIASESAVFSLSEVRLGLIPAVISPYVIKAIGGRQASRYMVSGERFAAGVAKNIGLLHEVVADASLDDAVATMTGELLKNGPQAMRECKDLIAAVINRPIDEALMENTSVRIARVRASVEGKEGLGSFLGKRSPSWLAEK